MNKTKTKWLKLPFRFDLGQLKNDLTNIKADEWIDHMNTGAYQKRWCCVPLYSVGGKSDMIYAFDDNADYLPTSILARCPYFRAVIDNFKCEKVAVRLMSLAAGDEIALHTDGYSAYDCGIIRLHIPIQTNFEVMFSVDGEQVHFSAGDCWYLNAECQHGVQNKSDQDRIHLMIDCRQNDWLETVFAAAGFVHDDPPEYGDPNINDENVQLVIQSLEAIGSDASMENAAILRQRVRLKNNT